MRLAATLSVFILAACKPAAPASPAEEGPLSPPDAPQRAHVHTEHGVTRDDPYHWMRDREDPAVIAYLEAENAYTKEVTAPLEPLRKQLFDELLGRIQEDDETVPSLHAGFWSYSRTVAGKPYRIYCRREGSLDAPEQIVLDVNALAEGKEYLDLGALEVRPDQAVIAYATDETGRELYDVRFRDLATGADLPDVIPDVWPDLAWSGDGKVLLYTRLDDSLRPYQVVAHVLGTDASADVVVYEETDERFRVTISRSADDRWLLLGADSSTTSEVRYAPADAPMGPYEVFSARHPGHEYAVVSQGDRFLVLTNDADDAQGTHTDDAVGFALKAAKAGATDRAAWTTLVPAREGVTLQGLDAFQDFLVLEEREEGLSHLRVIRGDGSDFRIAMPEAVWVAGLGDNPAFAQDHVRFTYTSLTTPPTVYDADAVTGALTLRKEQPVLGDFDKQRYVAERLWAPAPDGTPIPVSLVRRVDTPVDGSAPLLLYGYGAYGITIDPQFSSLRLSLLDRGVIFAIAHPRGGGFLGRPWKEAGKFAGKQHTFDDFVAAGNFLVAQGYTQHARMAIQGGSAGGLLIGAVINQAPTLAAHAVAQVPFVDVVTTMLDASIPLTTNEWEEWGDPREKSWFDVMLAYSPYDNVRQGPYPDLLVTSGLNDPRVQYWEPTKWVARLRDRVTNDPQILLKMEMGTGHGGKSGRYGYLEDVAFVQAWLLERWGLVTP
ncbi:MAG: S9 family peptidase [Alphaproteobacteria bacterium]|nr:S9 family peptidase [Alphaproteobacteria bacterium]